MNFTGNLIPCSCGNNIEPIIHYSNETTNGYEGIYFVMGQSYLADALPKKGTPSIVNTVVSKPNENITPPNPKVAVISPRVAVPTTCVDFTSTLSDTPTEHVEHEPELKANEPSVQTISNNSICAVIADAVKSFHKSGRKLQSVKSRFRPTVSYDALTASLLWAMERIFQAVRNEERSTFDDEEVEADWYAES